MHLDLAIPNFGIQEFIEHDPRVSDVFRWDTRLVDGYLVVAHRPGLGVEVDEAVAHTYPYAPAYLPTLRDDMGAVHNW